jgi:hypothetical protein
VLVIATAFAANFLVDFFLLWLFLLLPPLVVVVAVDEDFVTELLAELLR